jgi:hypothetical protein
MMRTHYPAASNRERICSMDDVLDLTAAALHRRWRRAVDLLWRETVRYRNARLAGWERLRSARRRRSLQKIVRKALSEFHRIELERQKRSEQAAASP